MKKIRYLTPMGVPRGKSIAPGDEAEVSDAEAERLIAKGFAELVDGGARRGAKRRSTSEEDE